MAMTGYGVAYALSVLVALAAAVTSLAVTADLVADLPSGVRWRWWQIVVIACSAASMLAALLVLLVQTCRCCGARCAGPNSPLALLFTMLGAAVHCGMLVAFTVYLTTDFSGDLFVEGDGQTSFNGGSCVDSNNAFDCFGSWPTKWKVMYIFGCAIGLAAWLLALLLCIADMSMARRRQVAVAPQPAMVAIGQVDEFVVRKQAAEPVATVV
ncbi:hypothetical protein ABPG77_003196 [Micractinium sp. CCAP 211/92]